MGGSASVIPVIPPENPDAYRWRGDMGILDRLAYTSDAREIPTNWEMTTMDTDNMANKLHVSERTPIEATEITKRISDQAHINIEVVSNQDNRGPGPKPVREESNTEISAAPPKKKRY
jgi:hypothetical protein